MREAIGDDCDAHAMQAETSLTAIEEKLCKVFRLVKKHARRHTNLFLAYFDQREKTGDKDFQLAELVTKVNSIGNKRQRLLSIATA